MTEQPGLASPNSAHRGHVARLSVADRFFGAPLLQPPRPSGDHVPYFSYVATGSQLAVPAVRAARPRRIVWFSIWDTDVHPETEPGDEVDAFADGWTAWLTPLRSSNRGFDELDLRIPRSEAKHAGPVLVVTVDTTKWTGLRALTSASAPAEKQVLAAPGFEWGIGAARPPMFSTFSIWESAGAAARYAHGSSPSAHRDAVAIEERTRFFKRWAVIRFRIDAERGTRPTPG